MVKHIDHLNITVSGLDESLRWYGELFGFEVQERGVYQGHDWAIVRAGEALLCLYEHPELDGEGQKGHGVNHFGLRVEDGERFAARAEQLGVSVKFGGVVDWPHSQSWYVADPTGHEIEVACWDGDSISFEGLSAS